MTSEPGFKSEWTCGWTTILNDLGWLASLEFPVYPSEKPSSNPAPQKVPLPSSSTSTSFDSEASSMPVPRISLPRPAFLKPQILRTTPRPLRSFSTSCLSLSGNPGRKPDEHVVNRTDEKDVQSIPSHQGMREKDNGESPAVGISEKGGADNTKAEQDNPEAPKPVIGMNDERGGKGH
jgi:hypothetical protein